MNLWIRSQNRELLVQVNMVYIDEHNMICDGRTNVLGEYETKERALEVLNKIQGRITANECLKSMVNEIYDIEDEEENVGKLFKEMVYEMPEE